MAHRTIVLLFGLTLIASACGSDVVDDGRGPASEQLSVTTTEPPVSVTTASPAGPRSTASSPDHTTVSVYLFLDDVTATNRPGPFLVPVARSVPKTTDGVAAALEALLKGPTAAEADSIPALSTAIPANTLLLGVSIADGVATVDLSRQYEAGGGRASMFGRLAQVVYTMTGFPTIESVSFLLDGQPVTVFSGEGILLEEPVDRNDYLDLVPGILVEEPAYGGVLDFPARVTGIAAAFEATFRIAITDYDGRILVENRVMTDNGMGWGDFDETIPYEVDTPQRGSLIVWENSAKDGSRINIREHPVWLTAAP